MWVEIFDEWCGDVFWKDVVVGKEFESIWVRCVFGLDENCMDVVYVVMRC